MDLKAINNVLIKEQIKEEWLIILAKGKENYINDKLDKFIEFTKQHFNVDFSESENNKEYKLRILNAIEEYSNSLK